MIGSRIIGTGRGVPPRVLTNDDLVEDGRHVRRLDRRAHRHPRAPHPGAVAGRERSRRPRRRARPAARPASIRRPSTASSSARSRATARSRRRRPSCRRSWARRRAAAPSICRRPAPASSTACRSATRSCGAGSSSACWSSASRCSRASSTGPIAAPACCSATARARCCWRPTTARRARHPVDAPLRRRHAAPTSCCQPAGGSREPLTPAAIAEKRHFVKMNGREVYKHAVRNMAAALEGGAGGQRPHARRRRPG